MELGHQIEYDRSQNKHVKVPVVVPEADRLRHMYPIGKTGTGKSTFLKSVVLQDIHAGRGCAYFDPHGPDSADLLEMIPPWRTKDVMYFNAADRDYPPSFNPVARVEAPQIPVYADMLMEMFEHLWQLYEVPTAQLEEILYNGLAAVIDLPDGTLLSLKYLLTDEAFRSKAVAQVNDPMIQQFWEQDFDRPDKEQRQITQSTLNKVGRFLSDVTIRNIIGQTRNRIDFDDIINNRKIFIANLSQSEIGPNKARLLGGLLIAQLAHSAQKPHDHKFHFIVDEFQMFASSAFPHLLSTIRKFGMSLTLSHQFLDQLHDKGLTKAILGNTGTIVTFTLGPDDSEKLSPYLDLTPVQLAATPPYVFHVKTLHGTKHQVHTNQPKTYFNLSESIITNSRNQYAQKIDDVTQRIEKFIVGQDKRGRRA